jgi:hypothetical protein
VTLLRKTLEVFVWRMKNWLAQGVDAPPKVALRLPIAKTFYTRRTALVERLLPRQTGGFYDRFLNNYFTL